MFVVRKETVSGGVFAVCGGEELSHPAADVRNTHEICMTLYLTFCMQFSTRSEVSGLVFAGWKSANYADRQSLHSVQSAAPEFTL